MENRKPEELKQIARDLLAGRIFTDRHITRPEDLPMVFMPLALMDKKQLKALAKSKPDMMFEYLDKAAPRSINGMPCFFSMQMLSKEDTATVCALHDEMTKAVNKVLKKGVKCNKKTSKR